MNFQEQLNDIQSKSGNFPPSNILLSQKIYSDLVLAKKWKNVVYKPVNGLDICVFLANEPSTSEKLIILPIFQDTEKLSLKRISDIFELLASNQVMDTPIEKFTMAIYSTDSTIVYYHINKGLIKAIPRNK